MLWDNNQEKQLGHFAFSSAVVDGFGLDCQLTFWLLLKFHTQTRNNLLKHIKGTWTCTHKLEHKIFHTLVSVAYSHYVRVKWLHFAFIIAGAGETEYLLDL